MRENVCAEDQPEQAWPFQRCQFVSLSKPTSRSSHGRRASSATSISARYAPSSPVIRAKLNTTCAVDPAENPPNPTRVHPHKNDRRRVPHHHHPHHHQPQPAPPPPPSPRRRPHPRRINHRIHRPI